MVLKEEDDDKVISFLETYQYEENEIKQGKNNISVNWLEPASAIWAVYLGTKDISIKLKIYSMCYL